MILDNFDRFFFYINPILDEVRAHPILDGGGGGKKAPHVNSAI